MHSGRLVRFLLCLVVAGCGDDGQGSTPVTPDAPEPEPPPDALAATCNEANVTASLRALPSVTAVTEQPCGDYVEGQARCFGVQFEQPIDHSNAQSKLFSQRLFLVHRGCEAPNLVADWGYSNDYFFDDELSVLYQTNALWIEHRFQGESMPAPADWDWTALTIENGAKDMHRIITTFRLHYGKRWVSTGASKGGITATYHKHFFPDDVDGSVPYVAPASRARIDPEYQAYLNATLSTPCAQRLRAAQVAALTSRRPLMLARIGQEIGLGNPALTLEYMTVSFDWGFWQYYGTQYCSMVPASNATDEAFWQFFYVLSGYGSPAPGADEDMSYGALYYEWLTEQGFALQVGAHIESLLAEPAATETMADSFSAQFPSVTLPAYNGAVTAAVRTWVRDEAENVVLIYGEFDPWSGGAMETPTRATSARFFVPAATHGAQIVGLAAADEAAALAHTTRMFDKQPMISERPAARRAASNRQSILDTVMRRQQSVGLRQRIAR